MAIYRLEAKIISRGNGHSAVAAAAYRTATKIRDERADVVHDYLSRAKGVVQSVILRPENSPEWTASTASLWNTVELSEKRKDAQLSREFILALPRELSGKEQFECAVEWAQKELVNRGMIAEVSLHSSKNGKNPHVHILCTLRMIEGDKFSAKKPREWNDKGLLLLWRKSWEEAENAALEKAGQAERVSSLSLKARGLDQIPEPKIGKEAAGLKKRGVIEDPERYQEVRKVKLLNEAMPFIRAIEQSGAVRHYGPNMPWWDKTMVFVSRVRGETTKAIKNAWQKLVGKSRGQDPELER